MAIINAEIITIGDEILIGQILDTNSQWIAEQLSILGLKVTKKLSIGDTKEAIIQALESVNPNTQYIFLTGGLGPTKDDITKKTLADYFNSPLEINPQRLKELEAFYALRGKTMNELTKTQALLPTLATSITNEVGTANSMWFTHQNQHFISMPGVPYEMKKMMTDTILPKIASQQTGYQSFHHTIRTVGISESQLALMLKEWEEALPSHIKLAYLPSLGMVKLRLSGYHPDKNTIQNEINTLFDQIKPLISKFIYGENTTELEETVASILINQNKTIALAESCTGGYLASLFTALPGASKYFLGSIVSYANSAKTHLLHVDEAILASQGAVSEATVIQMAKMTKQQFGSSIGVATSGIAGPDGGTPNKPVGTIWIAYVDDENTIAQKLELGTLRKNNIHLTAINVLNLIRKKLLHLE